MNRNYISFESSPVSICGIRTQETRAQLAGSSPSAERWWLVPDLIPSPCALGSRSHKMDEPRPTSDSSQLSPSPEAEPPVTDETTGQAGPPADDPRELAHAPVLSRRTSVTDHSRRKRVRESEHGPSTPRVRLHLVRAREGRLAVAGAVGPGRTHAHTVRSTHRATVKKPRWLVD